MERFGPDLNKYKLFINTDDSTKRLRNHPAVSFKDIVLAPSPQKPEVV